MVIMGRCALARELTTHHQPTTEAMDTVKLELSKLHGFRLLGSSLTQRDSAPTAKTLPQVLGARLGSKDGRKE